MHPPHFKPTFHPFKFTEELKPLVILIYSFPVHCMYETHTVFEQVLQEDAVEQVPAFEHVADALETVSASMSVTIRKIDIIFLVINKVMELIL